MKYKLIPQIEISETIQNKIFNVSNNNIQYMVIENSILEITTKKELQPNEIKKLSEILFIKGTPSLIQIT